MRIGSLFSGIGGLELGLERAGLGRVVWQVEINPFCRLVLAKHWPEADRSVVDVRKAHRGNLAPVDLIAGGFPCQDVAAPGKRAGLAGARSGLWYEYRRIVDELRPPCAVVENVASGESLWLPYIEADFAALGYRTQALRIAACDVGAPHRRARIFVVAYPHGERLQAGPAGLPGEERAGRPELGGSRGVGQSAATGSGLEGAGLPGPAPERGGGDVAHPDARGRSRVGGRWELDRGERAPRGDNADRCGGPGGLTERGRAAPQPPMDRGADGLPDRLVRRPDGAGGPVRWPAGRGQPQHEWEPPRAIRRGTVNDHEAALEALGNAVVPQCAEVVGRWIVENACT